MSIGMGWGMTMRRVILPQAIRIALPPYGNIMIMMLKDSSQASTITVAELALQGKLIASSTFKNTSVYTLVALMYLAHEPAADPAGPPPRGQGSARDDRPRATSASITAPWR